MLVADSAGRIFDVLPLGLARRTVARRCDADGTCYWLLFMVCEKMDVTSVGQLLETFCENSCLLSHLMPLIHVK